MPRVASQQICRANTASNTPFHCYLRDVCYYLLDHIIQGIDNRFEKYGSTIYLMYALIPSVIVKREYNIKIYNRGVSR